MEIFVIRDGEQTGPFDEGVVRALLGQGAARPQDLAWRKGLPRWLPLSEVLGNDAGGAGEPPGMPSAADARGANGSSPGRELATAKQKAFLKYLGVEFGEDADKRTAALAISDALENPKAQARIRKWHDEKLRLHPDVFQDEIDLRKLNRANRYLELVQTEGADVLKDVTKAHVQVLVESLDRRVPNWEAEPRVALWDYLFPSIGEHFPQLVQPAYKERLKLGGTLMAAAQAPGSLAGGARNLIPPPSPPGTLAAMWRGVFFGVLALGAIVAGLHFWQQWQAESSKKATPAPGAGKQAATEGAPPAVEAAPPAPEPAVPESAPPRAEAKPPIEPAELPRETLAASLPPAPVAPEPAAPMAAEKPAAVEEKPVPAAPPSPAEATPPAVPPPAPVPRTQITLVQGIGVALPNGQVNLPAGTRLRYLASEGKNVRVSWNNSVFFVPAIATDVGDNPVAAPAIAPQPMGAPAVPTAPSVKPEPPKKPSDDL